MSPTYRPASVPAGQAVWQGAFGSGTSPGTIVDQTCQGFGRLRVRQPPSSSHGETFVGFRASRVTDDQGIQPRPGSGRVIGPWRGASGVGPSTVASDITTTGHSTMQIEQPMHSPTWMGCSIVQRSGPPPGPASMPGWSGRLMSRACTGQTSMQTPQLMQLA